MTGGILLQCTSPNYQPKQKIKTPDVLITRDVFTFHNFLYPLGQSKIGLVFLCVGKWAITNWY